jgi:coenzyme F420-dependent glucose-6-phosphate dehydrogenase
VCAPGQRYNPAIVAQAAATLGEMFPGRYWIALGSGQNLNEHITGDAWPIKDERNARLLEAVDVIRALWAGETVTHYGRFTVEEACLYTRPQEPPLIVGAAVTVETARWAGAWADALITISKPRTRCARWSTRSARAAARASRCSCRRSSRSRRRGTEALRAAHEEWGTNIFDSPLLTDLRMPRDFEAAAKYVRPEDVTDASARLGKRRRTRGVDPRDVELGFERVYLHNVHRDQRRFIDVFGARCCPQLR